MTKKNWLVRRFYQIIVIFLNGIGGDWKAWMLRNKSTDDLHKLWFVLLIERNALLAEKQECKRRQIIMPNPSRKVKVQKSMARIKFILHERSVEYKKNLKN